jgi:hypothetical protein
MNAEEPDPPPLYFRQVLAEELVQVRRGRRLRFLGRQAPAGDEEPVATPDAAYRQAHEAHLIGLAFSGGGIRSATFNLGMLQALAELGLLKIFDYLSTVSGGGYIGGWWSAALERARGTFEELGQALNPPPREVRGPREDGRIRFLRSYSNYLTPRLGVLSQDTWAVVAIYLRNFLLNLAILVAALSAVLLVPRLVLWLAQLIAVPSLVVSLNAALRSPPLAIPAAGALVTSVLTLLFIWRNLGDLPLAPGERFARRNQPGWIFAWIVLPALGSALFTAGFLWALLAIAPWGWLDRWWIWPMASAVLYTVCSLPAAVAFVWQSRRQTVPTFFVSFFVSPLVAGAFGGAMLYFLLRYLSRLYEAEYPGLPFGLAFAPPLLLLSYILAGMLHLGIEGRGMRDERREWLSRLGGWLLQIALAWCGLFLIAFWSPVLVAQAGAWGRAALSSGWIVSTLAGVLAGRSGRADGRRPTPVDRLVRLAPPVFIVGLLVFLSVGIDAVLRSASHPPFEPILKGRWLQGFLGQAGAVFWSSQHPAPILWGLAVTVAVALLLSWRVDINEFSMHLFYRNRLIRCYLGASNPCRRPNPFTGFDPGDDLPLASLDPDRGYAGPLPIVNTAINLVHGEDLAWQERKAASFTFTPLHCGYDLARIDADGKDEADGSYRPAGRFAGPDGVSLGTACAISGAAASPNMGYHSSPALSFLMTVFNVRLGWWLGNPAHAKTWRRSGPPVGLLYLFSELLGLTNARSSYVYLSDGGHFENLGVYELVKRRCRLVVAVDAGQDGEVAFCDLGNAIRKCRNDLGIDLEIDTSSMRPGPTGLSTWHCAVGRIRYDRVDPGAAVGVLVYLKPTLSGDEPTDLLNYRSLHPEFPHQSTGDQFFDESQFESYRKLGYHVGKSVFEDVATASRREAWSAVEPFVESLIAELKERWFPPSAAAAHFTRHAAALDQLYDRLRRDERLRFLDDQIYPEWRSLLAAAGTPPGSEPPPQCLWLPPDAAAVRQGFYFSLSLLQLMEMVYLDLHLDTEADHPDHRGFLNLFKHWSWSGMVRVTWAIAAATFGLRFQRFCERRLGLELGRVEPLLLPAWGPAELEAAGLNVLERRLIAEFPAHARQPFDGLVVFRLAVAKPGEAGGEPFSYPFGFALLQGGKLLYLRVQDHLRTMGLARQALKALIELRGITDFVDPAPWFPGYQTRAAETLRTTDADRARRLFLSQRLQATGYGHAADSIPVAEPPAPTAAPETP